jgi:hypothetical protein
MKEVFKSIHMQIFMNRTLHVLSNFVAEEGGDINTLPPESVIVQNVNKDVM